MLYENVNNTIPITKVRKNFPFKKPTKKSNENIISIDKANAILEPDKTIARNKTIETQKKVDSLTVL